MINMFFYGTLRHLPLLEIVLGRPASSLDIADVSLPGHAVMAVAQGPFPMIVTAQDQQADGIIVRGLSEDETARLTYYEAGFDYDLLPVTLADGQTAEVYFPSADAWTPDGPWDLRAWVAKWGEMSCLAATEVMNGFGTIAPAQVAQWFERIRARALSAINAQSSRHGVGTLNGRVEILERARPYSKFFAIDDILLRHETFAGGMTEPLQRAVFVSSDAAIVLPYDPVRDRVLLVEQIRMGPLARNDRTLWHMEPVAGLIDPGETPAEAAHREAHEEASLRFDRLEAAGECYASPGASTDFFYLFVGLCDLPDDVTGVGGAPDEGENIRSHILPFADLLALAEARKTGNAPLTLLTYWLAHHRARLRSAT
ncbi:NUDIX domain-containing protein [Tateyamaria pelophila]|uniref:NUDIX domain-containing protein n=1 Tax=Tateyamaria pelophila TaxID=328415 RepID=UPI001CBCF026|nr:NUDIX domain-containing protein [Tateyamaria pelophila]